MNCQRLREYLYDYLDDSLSFSEKAAARKHLAECPLCRDEAQREQQLAQSISSRLEQVVGPVVLSAHAQSRMAAAVERNLAESCERPLVSFWSRLALPFAAVSAIIIVAIWTGYRFIAEEESHLKTAQVSLGRSYGNILVNVSYRVPSYTFHRQGNQIVDALTYDKRFAEGTLTVKNWKPQVN